MNVLAAPSFFARPRLMWPWSGTSRTRTRGTFPSKRFWQRPRRRGSAPRRASTDTRRLLMVPQHSPASRSSKEAPTRRPIMIRMRPRTTSRRALPYWYGPRSALRWSRRRARRSDTRPRACSRAAPRRCPHKSGLLFLLLAAVLASGGGRRRAARAGRPAPARAPAFVLVLVVVRASSA